MLASAEMSAPEKEMTTTEHQERFQALLNEHKRILYKVCHSYCRNRDDREDLAQEIIIQLWQSFVRFDDRYRFSTWMYRIALNVAISFQRRERTRTRHLIWDDERVLDAVDETESQPDDVRVLYQFIERLDELNKALVLLYLDGNIYKEIADVLGISETNVASKINRLKNSLKRDFSGSRQAG
jgi:RNA polymerase sigma factor (sigma-70 family)